MNVLIVSPYFAPYSGVGANRMISLSVYLRDNHYSVAVIRNISKKEISFYTAEEPTGIKYYDIGVKDDSDFNMMSELYINETHKVLSDQDIGCVIISLGPYYTYKAAEHIRSVFSVPVILDYRDLFVYERPRRDGIIKQLRRARYHASFKTAELSAINAAVAIVTVVPDDQIVMQRHYKGFRGLFELIMNGYDESRILSGNNRDSLIITDTACKIGVFGKLGIYNIQLTTKLFKAIKRLREAGINVCIYHMGTSDDITLNLAKDIGLNKDAYQYLGSYDYSTGIAILRQMDMFSLVYSSPTGYGTKVFDYIYLNKPIVMMAKRGTALGRFVESFENGFCCTNTELFVSAVKKIITNKAYLLDKGGKVSMYSRAIQNGKFVSLIERVKKR